jgi:hypothetical protein
MSESYPAFETLSLDLGNSLTPLEQLTPDYGSLTVLDQLSDTKKVADVQ